MNTYIFRWYVWVCVCICVPYREYWRYWRLNNNRWLGGCKDRLIDMQALHGEVKPSNPLDMRNKLNIFKVSNNPSAVVDKISKSNRNSDTHHRIIDDSNHASSNRAALTDMLLNLSQKRQSHQLYPKLEISLRLCIYNCDPGR